MAMGLVVGLLLWCVHIMEYPAATKSHGDIYLFTWENFRMYYPLKTEEQEREKKKALEVHT